MGKQEAPAVLMSAKGTCYMLLEKLVALTGKAHLKEMPENPHHCVITTQKEPDHILPQCQASDE